MAVIRNTVIATLRLAGFTATTAGRLWAARNPGRTVAALNLSIREWPQPWFRHRAERYDKEPIAWLSSGAFPGGFTGSCGVGSWLPPVACRWVPRNSPSRLAGPPFPLLPCTGFFDDAAAPPFRRGVR